MLNRVRDVFKSFQQHDVKYVVIGMCRPSRKEFYACHPSCQGV
jgi:hypothetical protein